MEAMVGRAMMDIRKMRSLVRGFRLAVYDDGQLVYESEDMYIELWCI
jgi:hypothetical protein